VSSEDLLIRIKAMGATFAAAEINRVRDAVKGVGDESDRSTDRITDFTDAILDAIGPVAKLAAAGLALGAASAGGAGVVALSSSLVARRRRGGRRRGSRGGVQGDGHRDGR
jgi:hypothetical protein